MSKKPDLSKAFGERFKTEEKVDVQDPLAVAASLNEDTGPKESKQESTNARMQARVKGNVQVSTPEDTNENTGPKESKQESTNARMQARVKDNVQASTPEDKHTNVHVNSPERKQTRKQERTQAAEQAYIDKGVEIDMLYDQIQQKKHLSNGSFRYRADELEKLDAIFKELEEKKPGRISKNDIARMALIAFYEDYEKNGDESVLAQVFKRM